MRQRLCLMSIACLTLLLHGCAAAAGAQAEPSAGTPLLAPASLLHIRAAEPEMTASLQPAAQDWRSWTLADPSGAAVLRIADARRPDQWADYLIASWQDMRPVSPVDPAAVFAVTTQAVVVGPVAAEAADPAFVDSTRRIMGAMADRALCQRAAATNHGITLLPYAAKVDLDGLPPSPSWHELAADRMVLELHRGRLVALHAPREVDRSRPRPFDPAEQRLSPQVDLAAARRRLDAGLRRVFDQALHDALLLDQPTAEAREAVYREALPELEKVIFDYPGHTGPAFAAGGQALARQQQRLREVLIDLGFPSADRGDWRGGLLAHSPHLASALLELPPAVPDALPALLAAFDQHQALAAALSGDARDAGPISDDAPSAAAALIAAEAGDRLRTAAHAADRDGIRKAMGDRDGAIAYLAYRLWVEGAPENPQPKASPPVEVRFNLSRAAGPPAPLGQ